MATKRTAKTPLSICPITNSVSARAAAYKQTAKIKDSFPKGIAQPALRALAGAGFTHLSQLTTISERALAELHGMGPKALSILRDALHASGKAFSKE